MFSSILALQNFWIAEIFILAAVFFISNQILKKVGQKIGKNSKSICKEKSHLIRNVLFPIQLLLALLLISFGLQILMQRFEILTSFQFLVPLRNLATIALAVWFLFRWKQYLYHSFEKSLCEATGPFDSFSLQIAGKVFNIVIIFIALLITLQILGLDIVPFITFGGVGIAAIGFAAKDIIANYVSGFLLYATRPFSIGDQIEIPEKNILGHIEEIGWCLTSIRDLQKRPVFIPNTLFSSALLINYSRMTHRCIQETIQIRFSDAAKIPQIQKKIRSLLQNHPNIDQNLPIYVYLQAFGIYSLELEIRAYVIPTRYEEFMTIKQEILLEIQNQISQEEAAIVYLTSLPYAQSAIKQ